MARQLPPLNSLRAFEVASRHMSFQKAAEELNVTPSALSYQIRQLEDFLQIQLFERLNRSVALTESGRRLEPGTRDAFEQLHDAVNRVRSVAPGNVLTVTTGPAFAAKWLTPRLHGFLERHPEIDIRISASLKLFDFHRDEVDVAIRFGSGNYPRLHCETLTQESAVPLVSPQLVQQSGGTFNLENLKDVLLIHDDSAAFMPDAANWETWLHKAGVRDIDPTRGPRFSHADHAIDAAIDGTGIVLGRTACAMRDILSGRLIAPFDLMIPSRANFYFVCLPEALQVPKVKAFRTFVFEEAERDRAAFELFNPDTRQNRRPAPTP